MEDLVTEIVKQVPSLAVLAFIVWTFIKFLSTANEAVQGMHKECHDTQMKVSSALAEHTEAVNGLGVKIDDWAEHRPTNGRG